MPTYCYGVLKSCCSTLTSLWKRPFCFMHSLNQTTQKDEKNKFHENIAEMSQWSLNVYYLGDQRDRSVETRLSLKCVKITLWNSNILGERRFDSTSLCKRDDTNWRLSQCWITPQRIGIIEFPMALNWTKIQFSLSTSTAPDRFWLWDPSLRGQISDFFWLVSATNNQKYTKLKINNIVSVEASLVWNYDRLIYMEPTISDKYINKKSNKKEILQI